MTVRTLLLLGALGGVVMCGCSETGVNCDDQSQAVQWQLDTIAVAQQVAVNGIWGVSQSDAYAVGMVDSGQGPVGTVWHYNGSNWSVVHTRANAELEDVHLVSATSVWIAGAGNPNSYPGEALVLHWNGSSWEESYADPSVPGLLAIWAGADDEVYATGRDAAVLHFDGASWSQEDIEPPGLENFEFGDVRDVWGVGDDASSKVYVAGGYAAGIVVARQDNGPWQLEFVTPLTGYISHCVGVWARNVNDVYALELTGRGAASIANVYRHADTTWSQIFGVWGSFSGIRGNPNGDIFVLGAEVFRFVGDSTAIYEDFPGRNTFALNDVWPDRHTFLIAGSFRDLGVILTGESPGCITARE